MPLEPKYRWEESAAGLRVHVQLRGASPKSCDVSVSDCFVKVNAPPNLLALDLHGLIDDTASTVSFKADGLVLNLPKASPQLWSTLKAEPAEHGGRAGLKARREASIDRQRAAAEAARQQRITQRSVHKRLATHSQIDLDNAQRNLIDARKAEEKRAAEEDVYATLETVESQAAAAAATETGAPRAPEPELLVEDVTATPSAAMEPQRQPQPPPPKQQQMPLRSLKPTPITFTKDRKRPDHMQNLPARTKPEDLPRNESAPKPRNDDTVDLGEQNALFLKDRGDSFFGKKDYEAAVNAYSAALTLDRNLPAVFSNRAACFFCLSDYQRCVEDSSAANRLLRAKLELLLADKGAPGEEMQDSLKTELATTNRSLLRVLARRASARTFLGQHARAVTDYKEAVTLDPENSALRADLVEAEAAAAAAAQAEAEASEGRVLELKASADARFSQGDYAGAKAMYSEALALDGGHVGCLSNRAACNLCLGEDVQVVADCTAALTALDEQAEGVCPPPGNFEAAAQKRQRTRLRLHVRRGTALVRCGNRSAARQELKVCRELNPSAAELAQLEADLDSQSDAPPPPPPKTTTTTTTTVPAQLPPNSPIAG